MVVERAAAALVLRHHHLDAHAGQQADRRLVDRGCQHLLRAAGQQADAGAARADRRMHPRPLDIRWRRHRGRRQAQHRAQPLRRHRPPRHEARQRPAEPGADQRQAEPPRMRQHEGQHAAQRPFRPGAGVGLLDIGARVVDQVHVVHARWAGRHAGQAGQAAIDMAHHLLGRRLAAFQHLLDQVDAPARGIELVAQQQEGRAGRRAHAAMDAGAQDAVALGRVGVGQLGGREGGLHRDNLGARGPACQRHAG